MIFPIPMYSEAAYDANEADVRSNPMGNLTTILSLFPLNIFELPKFTVVKVRVPALNVTPVFAGFVVTCGAAEGAYTDGLYGVSIFLNIKASSIVPS